MQIILISSRTLGASELLLLLSLFSLVFFFPRCLFSCCNCCCFWSPPHSPPPPLYLLLLHRCHSSLSSLLPSGLVAGFVSSFIAASSTWPNPLRMPDAEEGVWEIGAEQWGGGGRSGVLVPLFGISILCELEPSSLSEVRSSQEKLTAGFGNVMDFMCCILSNTLKSVATKEHQQEAISRYFSDQILRKHY